MPGYCEDYPCCGHTPQDPCERQPYDEPGAFDTRKHPHALCNHEEGECRVEEDEWPDDEDEDKDEECNHNCDPSNPETRRLDTKHYLDCPVWTYLGVTNASNE